MTASGSGLEPVPFIDCGVCEALNEERAEAWRAADLVEVAKMNAEIRNHPHRRRRAFKRTGSREGQS